jgi:hypothetical protein
VIKNKKRFSYLVIALILGAALALAVAISRDDPVTEANAGSTTVASSAAAAAEKAPVAEDPLAIDPAKQEPVLDKFKSKDPFVPLASTNTSGGGDSTTGQTGLSAKVSVDGASSTVVKGDKVPSSNSVFTISSVASNSVTFALISGVLQNGSPSVSVNVGETVEATLDSGTTYTLKVISVGESTGGSTSGHSITVLSITDSNGTPMVTLEVDDKTFTDKKVSDKFSTPWGEIKIISINVSAQTVTVMHGDQTLTLRAGQVVVK